MCALRATRVTQHYLPATTTQTTTTRKDTSATTTDTQMTTTIQVRCVPWKPHESLPQTTITAMTTRL